MAHLLSIGVFICVLALCDSQSGSGYFMSRDSLYDSGRGGSYMGAGMGPSYMGADMGPSYMGADMGPSYMGADMGPSYMGTDMGPSYMGEESPYMGGSETSRDFADRSDRGRSGRRIGGRRESRHSDRSGRRIGGSRESRHSDRSGRRSDRRRDSRHSDRSDRRSDGRGYRPPREGYIGAYGGQRGFPVQGGYCAGGMCSDGGRSAGVGSGYGTGTQMAMDRRLRTGENERISTYEPFAGGPAVTGGGMTPGMGSPMGGGFYPTSGGLFGGLFGSLFG